MQFQDNTSPTPIKNKRRERVLREMQRSAAEATPATSKHDIQVEAYQRGSTDTLRAVMVFVQRLLAKHEGSQP